MENSKSNFKKSSKSSIKRKTLKDFFGKIKSKIDPQKMKDDSRKMWSKN